MVEITPRVMTPLLCGFLKEIVEITIEDIAISALTVCGMSHYAVSVSTERTLVDTQQFVQVFLGHLGVFVTQVTV